MQRLDRLKAEVRRQKDEGLRILARLKQIGVERQHMEAMLQSTQVAATQGREAALKQLAAQRRAAVERHVSEVLGTLEKSLSLVGPVFIDPAREAMLKGCEPRAEVSAGVLENAEKVAPIVDKLATDRAGTLRVVKVDMDDAQEICARYGVRAAPTLMLFVGGARVKSHVGLLNREKIEKLLHHREGESISFVRTT